MELLDRLLRRTRLGREVSAQRRSNRDLWAWNALSPLADRYAPWSTSSLAPRALVAVLNEIVVNDRQTIVECGAGTSSLFVGRLLRMLGRGSLLTVDHGADWAAWVEKQVAREALADRVQIVVAPLAPTAFGWDGGNWYQEEVLRDRLPGEPVDLLVVDGPPAYEDGTWHARYPALPFFAQYLSPDACVILDDADRDGEREVVTRWELESDFRFTQRNDLAIAVGRRQHSGTEVVL